MNLLLDTHVLLWLASDPNRLTTESRQFIGKASVLTFSVVSIWEIVVKHGLEREDFRIVPRRFYEDLLVNGFQELLVHSDHALAVSLLPKIHNDPFDRLLVAQAQVEDITLVTRDETISKYPGPIKVVN